MPFTGVWAFKTLVYRGRHELKAYVYKRIYTFKSLFKHGYFYLEPDYKEGCAPKVCIYRVKFACWGYSYLQSGSS